MSAEERVNEATSAEQENERAVRANKRAGEQMAQKYTRRFHSISTHQALVGPKPEMAFLRRKLDA